MKSLSILAIIGVLFMVSCSDDEDPISRMDFSYDGSNYPIAATYIMDFGVNPDNESRDYDLMLVSSSITFDDKIGDITGTGNFVYLDLNSASTTEFLPGNFTWSDTRGPNTIVDGGVGIDEDVQGSWAGVDWFASGTVTVTKNGDDYTISFNCTTDSGKEVSGSWTGPLVDISW